MSTTTTIPPSPTRAGSFSPRPRDSMSLSASPELRRVPLEVFLRPISTTHLAVEDQGRKAAKARPLPPVSNGEEEEECWTPTGPQCKIPAIETCPPAPKKAKMGAAATCRRRLLEVEFFRVAPEEVDRLFRVREREGMTTPPPPPPALLPAKKRKRCYLDEDE